jgi:hypothetical protein
LPLSKYSFEPVQYRLLSLKTLGLTEPPTLLAQG